ERLIPSGGAARSLDEKRDGPQALVLVGFAARPAFQHRERPMADIVVELAQCPPKDALIFAPRATLGEYRLEGACDEKWLEQVGFALMKEQVGMVFLVGGQQLDERQSQD